MKTNRFPLEKWNAPHYQEEAYQFTQKSLSIRKHNNKTFKSDALSRREADCGMTGALSNMVIGTSWVKNFGEGGALLVCREVTLVDVVVWREVVVDVVVSLLVDELLGAVVEVVGRGRVNKGWGVPRRVAGSHGRKDGETRGVVGESVSAVTFKDGERACGVDETHEDLAVERDQDIVGLCKVNFFHVKYVVHSNFST